MCRVCLAMQKGSYLPVDRSHATHETEKFESGNSARHRTRVPHSFGWRGNRVNGWIARKKPSLKSDMNSNESKSRSRCSDLDEIATEPLITARSVVYPWQCDHMGHMNVMWYTGKFDEATWHLFNQI